jgi:hypothetical protein
MKKLNKTQLLFGPYKQPVVERGGFLVCKARGKVRVGSWSQGRIPWPLEKKYGSYILCGDLLRAIENEAAAAMVHHWGVSMATVTTWRKQLGIGRVNPGSHQLYSRNAHNISVGRPRTEAFKKLTGRLFIERIRRGEVSFIRPEQLWKPREIRLLGTASDRDVAQKLGRSYDSVQLKRQRLGIAVFHSPAKRQRRRRRNSLDAKTWAMPSVPVAQAKFVAAPQIPPVEGGVERIGE